MTTTKILGILALLALAASVSVAADYRMDWYSINSGGGVVTGGSYKLDCSVGQPAAGFTKTTSFLHWIGFWAGEVPTPTVVPTIAAAKLLADRTFISVSGKIATSTEGDFSGFFYLEESDRLSGIRVAFPIEAVSGLVRGKSVVNVLGSMGTTSAGERQIAACVIVITSTNPLAIRSLGMNNRALGGGDFGIPPLGQYGVKDGVGLNNVGLLVTTWGRVSYVDSVYMTISDGSNSGVRVSTAQLAIPLPEPNDYISVIGISSLYMSGIDRVPQVLPRNNDDVN
jgi:hypothetical protein